MSTTTDESTPEKNTREHAGTPLGKGNGAEPHPIEEPVVPPIPIAKPTSSLNDFKSKRGRQGAGVETLRVALPHHKFGEARDFVRLHHDEDHWWSDELAFVSVPIKGQRRDLLHLVNEDLVPPDVLPQVQYFKLALASKPGDAFFLCHVPTRNLDNRFNEDISKACELAKTRFVKAYTDQKEGGADGYVVTLCRDADAFPDPKWPTQPLDDLITLTFGPDRIISHEDHPALRRLLGRRPSVS